MSLKGLKKYLPAIIFFCFFVLIRLFEDEKKAKMGVVECVKHELMQPYNVLYEKEGMIYKFSYIASNINYSVLFHSSNCLFY